MKDTDLNDRAIKLVLVAPNFFFIPLRKMTVEKSDVTAQTYFLKDDRIVAIGEPVRQ